ncbi:hypothetical protein GT23_0437 [Parageobacillus thermoglucosidasius]|nr:hypothetical protein GT23_0437 [Parageobacillus thermoglucosidasius]
MVRFPFTLDWALSELQAVRLKTTTVMNKEIINVLNIFVMEYASFFIITLHDRTIERFG